MENRYPTRHELQKIKKWPHEKGYKDLMEFIESIWWMPSWGWRKTRKNYYYISTGGWSGNEDIIQAMKSNYMFWSMCWLQSRRGGHFIFSVRMRGK